MLATEVHAGPCEHCGSLACQKTGLPHCRHTGQLRGQAAVDAAALAEAAIVELPEVVETPTAPKTTTSRKRNP